MAPFQVWSQFAVIAPHIEGSNADFAPHMEGSHTDFAPHMVRRHSFRDQKKLRLTFLIFKKKFCQTTYILEVYMTYLTTCENTTILRESTFKNNNQSGVLKEKEKYITPN